MKVKELITQLLECGMDKDIYISDEVETEAPKRIGDVVFNSKGSIYGIKSIEEGSKVYLIFENRNHYLRKEQECIDN